MVINLWPTFLAHPVYSFTRQRLQRNAILKRRNINIATIYITVTLSQILLLININRMIDHTHMPRNEVTVRKTPLLSTRSTFS